MVKVSAFLDSCLLYTSKGTVLNSDISSVISRLGHTDTLVVCDAGLPIPKSTTRIDMALTQGVPSFMQVLDRCV